jgi:hypothetical protein
LVCSGSVGGSRAFFFKLSEPVKQSNLKRNVR